MKKFLTVLLSVVFAVMLCVPMVACNKGGEQSERKRIIGIDSDKTYLKAKFYLKDKLDLNVKFLDFEILSYDKIETDELYGVSFDFATGDDRDKLSAVGYELRDTGNSFERDGYYKYYVIIEISMKWVVYEVQINSVKLNISGQEYVFSTDILFTMRNNRPVFIEPDFYGNTTGDPVKGPYCALIECDYELTLKSLDFQSEGFEILSYYVEAYNADLKANEKVTEELPVKLEANRQYRVYVEARPPQDCLYYNCELEAVVQLGDNLGELSGLELKYNNIEHGSDSIRFKGCALNALSED